MANRRITKNLIKNVYEDVAHYAMEAVLLNKRAEELIDKGQAKLCCF